MRDVSGLAAKEVFCRLRDAGLDSTPGTAAEVLHDGVRVRLDPADLIAAAHAAGRPAAERSTLYEIPQQWPVDPHHNPTNRRQPLGVQ